MREHLYIVPVCFSLIFPSFFANIQGVGSDPLMNRVYSFGANSLSLTRKVSSPPSQVIQCCYSYVCVSRSGST